MRKLCAHWILFTFALLVFVAAAVPAQAQAPNPEGRIHTFITYEVPSGKSYIYWRSCSTAPGASECGGGSSTGLLEPFTKPCAIVESAATVVDSSTLERYVYVLDAGTRAGAATLVAFKRVDTVQNFVVRISVTKEKTLPLRGLGDATSGTCLMAQNPTNVYVGLKGEDPALSINKKTNNVTSLAEDGGTLNSITADSGGFVSVSRTTLYNVYGPDGEEAGGRSFRTDGAFLINPANGVDPEN